MELSKMGPPLNSSTATTSRRRRPLSFRTASVAAAESWLMTLSPLGVRVSLVLTGLSLLHISPRSCASPQSSAPKIESTASRGLKRDKLTNQDYVDKATWREAFDHEAFHSEAVQGSTPRIRGPSPSGGSVPPGLFLPGGKGVDRPIPQGMGRGEKLAENIWLRKSESVV